MEKIMRKTDHTSNFGHGTFEDRTLDDKELDAVTGGAYGAQQVMEWVSYQTIRDIRQWVYGSPGHVPHG
jgi:bacteriocin-like protein